MFFLAPFQRIEFSPVFEKRMANNSPTVWCDEMIFYLQIFSTPCFHPKSKPFVDHILSFSIEDNRIWFRNFQVNTTLYYLSSTVFQGHELKECSTMIVVSSKFGFTVTLHQSALKLALRKGFERLSGCWRQKFHQYSIWLLYFRLLRKMGLY